MVTQFEDVANQVAQEKIGDKRLRNEAIRKGMQNPWDATKANAQTSSGTQPTFRTNVNSGSGTLASTYSNLLNNANAMGLSNSSSTGSSPSPTGKTSFAGGSMPGWGPSLGGKAIGILSGDPRLGLLSQLTLQLGSGDWKGAASQGAGTLANAAFGNKLPGIGGIVGSGVNRLLRKEQPHAGQAGQNQFEEFGLDVGNSLLSTGLSMANPILGTAYGLARLFGLDVARGAMDYTKSDINQRFDAGYNGGFFGGGSGNRGSWNATNGTVGSNNTYSGSGYGNTAGPGSGGLVSDKATNSTSSSGGSSSNNATNSTSSSTVTPGSWNNYSGV